MSHEATNVAAPLRPALITALVAGLTACGDGGGGSGGGGFGLPLVTPAPAPTDAAAPAPAPAPAATPTVHVDAPARVVTGTLYRYAVAVNDGIASAWRWAWGDGSPDGDSNPTNHVWNRPGSFSMTAQATVGDATPSANQAVSVVSRPVIAGSVFTCGIKLDGTVACWGDNSYGQLGDGTTESRSTPVTVQGLSNVMGLGLGRDHACALKQDGSVVCSWNACKRGSAMGQQRVARKSRPMLSTARCWAAKTSRPRGTSAGRKNRFA
ncbi:PKD domain-containing protein [Variovorax boronicumulans]|uniref:PKD domain-containing protein n=1 Tax=Variovorax boronicumulans TaxID=436515 RepID=UPI00132FF455|nr:hypothetical protein [Variovorax boronicumulans]